MNYFHLHFSEKLYPQTFIDFNVVRQILGWIKSISTSFFCTLAFDKVINTILNTYPLESVSPQAYWVMRTFQLLVVEVVPPMLKRAVWQVLPVRSASTITKKNIKSCIFHDNFLALFQNYFWTMVHIRKTRS